MKRTQVKDALRNIRKQKVSWFAIVVIAMLSVTAYLGINFASQGIDRNANRFYDETRFRDIEILSTLLITPKDIEALRDVEGVADAEGVLQTSGKIERSLLRENVDVVSLTERINISQLLEGRLPETDGECAVEKTILTDLELSVGDTIHITDARGNTAEYLLRQDFVITGVVHHPDHACWPLQVPGNRDVLVLPQVFDRDALEDCCMKAVIRVEGTGGLDRFDKAYKKAVDAVAKRLEALRTEREPIRNAEIQGSYQARIDAGHEELEETLSLLEAARAELDKGLIALEDGEKQIAEAEKQLAVGKRQLEQTAEQLEGTEGQLSVAEAELRQAKTTLDEGAAQLRDAKTQLDESKSQLEEGWNQLEDAKASVRNAIRGAVEEVLGGDSSEQIRWAERIPADVDNASPVAADFWIIASYKCDMRQSLGANITNLISSDALSDEYLLEAYIAFMGTAEGFDAASMRAALAEAATAAVSQYEGDYNALAAACADWDTGHEEYLEGLSAYQTALDQYNAGFADYTDGMNRYQAGLAAYQNGLNLYTAKLAEYEQGVSELEAGKKQLEEERRRLQDGEAQYEDGLAAYKEGAERLSRAQTQLDELDQCRWVILTAEGNASYLTIRTGVQNVADMGMTFALVFVLVGALVIYATVGRIVEEQRRLVGATKALGFFNREIFAKYLGFGVSATMLGMLLGMAAGYFGIQRILLYVYGRYYVFGAGKNAFLIGMTLVVFIAGIALASLAVWSACSALMRSSATSLMQEKAPELRHKQRKAGKTAGSLYSRLILLNMRSDMKRVVVTVASVAGCCALLVAGFTMRQSVMKALNAQFDEVARYDMQIRFDPETSADAQSELEALLTQAGTDWTLIHSSTQTFSVSGRLLSATLFCGDLSDLDRFYARLDPVKDQALARDRDGIWIHQRIAEMNDVSEGDQIQLYDKSMKPYTLPVAGIFRLYAGREIILAADQYEACFGVAPEENTFLLFLNGAEAAPLKAAAKDIPGVENISDIAETRALYQSFASVLNLIALMMVGIAGLMAYFILLNLVNMVISQKKRELTIMRVNGFTVREVDMYVLREMILSTAIGIVLGLFAGSLLGYRVTQLLEGSSVRFMRGIQWESWLYAAVITTVYAVIINLAALKNVKTLKLTDV